MQNPKTRLPKIIQIHYPSPYLQSWSNDIEPEPEQHVSSTAPKNLDLCKKSIKPRKSQPARIDRKPASSYVERITCPARRMFYEQKNHDNPMVAKKTASAEPNRVHRLTRNNTTFFKSSNVEQGDRGEVKFPKKTYLNQNVIDSHLKYGVFCKNHVANSIRVQPHPKNKKPLSPLRSAPLKRRTFSPMKRKMSPIKKSNRQINCRSVYGLRAKLKCNRLDELAQSELMHLDIRPIRDDSMSPSPYHKIKLPLHKSTSPSFRETKSRFGYISPSSFRNLSPSIRVSTSYYNVSSNRSNSLVTLKRSLAHRGL